MHTSRWDGWAYSGMLALEQGLSSVAAPLLLLCNKVHSPIILPRFARPKEQTVSAGRVNPNLLRYTGLPTVELKT